MDAIKLKHTVYVFDVKKLEAVYDERMKTHDAPLINATGLQSREAYLIAELLQSDIPPCDAGYEIVDFDYDVLCEQNNFNTTIDTGDVFNDRSEGAVQGVHPKDQGAS